MKKQILSFIPIVAIALAGILSSCSKDKLVTYQKFNLMVTHASPDAPDVDLLVENIKENAAPLSYLGSTNYLTFNSGTRNVKVNVAGTSTNVINADVNFNANTNYSLFAIDSVSKLSTLLITDDLSAPAAGKAHVRFIHLSPNAPAVDVAVAGGGVVFPNKSFKEYTAFTPLDAGTYNLEVRVAGTSTVALSLPPITLASGKIYTVYARGFLGAVGTQHLDAQIITNN